MLLHACERLLDNMRTSIFSSFLTATNLSQQVLVLADVLLSIRRCRRSNGDGVHSAGRCSHILSDGQTRSNCRADHCSSRGVVSLVLLFVVWQFLLLSAVNEQLDGSGATMVHYSVDAMPLSGRAVAADSDAALWDAYHGQQHTALSRFWRHLYVRTCNYLAVLLAISILF
eukprot:SAG31_NODE_1480_length_8180_cov_5.458978_9_plen_171_part_00